MSEITRVITENLTEKEIESDPNYQVKLRSCTNELEFEFEDEAHFTWRSVIVGSLLGIVVVASNMYLGLKSGNTFSANMFGAIIGFVILKPLSGTLPKRWGGGKFGLRENCSLQSAAVAVGSLSAGFQSGIPGMYLLKLLPPVDEAWGMFLLWTTVAAFHGMFFGIPLRSYFILKQKLRFPTPTAAAETIRTLHSSSKAAQSAFQQGRWIFLGFFLMTFWKVLSFFVPGIWDFHIFYGIGTLSGSNALIQADIMWKWRVQTTGAFFGSGMLMGLNNAASFFLGSVLAFGIAGPILFNYTTIVSPNRVYGFSKDGLPTVQYWFIWPGVAIIVTATFVELLMNSSSLLRGFKGLFKEIHRLITNLFQIKSNQNSSNQNSSNSKSNDPVPPHLRIPSWIWGPGLILTSLGTVLVLNIQFHVPISACLTALILGFLMAFVGTQSAGDVDINPLGSIGKITQFVFATFSYPSPTIALKSNLLLGTASLATAAQAVDMVSDLHTGHILRASPKSQFYAQFVGSSVGIVAAVVMFWVFAKAYPCVLDRELLEYCPFQVPAGVAWASVAEALVTGVDTIPLSSAITSLICSIITAIIVILRKTYFKHKPHLLPNMNALGMALVTPQPYIPLASIIGAIIGTLWKRYSPQSYDEGGVGFASGLLAGEGIGGVIHAIFNVAGIVQANVGWGLLCPYLSIENCST